MRRPTSARLTPELDAWLDFVAQTRIPKSQIIIQALEAFRNTKQAHDLESLAKERIAIADDAGAQWVNTSELAPGGRPGR